jgi:gas vesicle protein
MSKSSHFIEGFVIGVLSGVMAGILLAPQSGEETRQRIRRVKEENEELIEDSKTKTEDLVAKTLDAIDRGFEKLSDMVEDKKNGAKAPKSTSTRTSKPASKDS